MAEPSNPSDPTDPTDLTDPADPEAETTSLGSTTLPVAAIRPRHGGRRALLAGTGVLVVLVVLGLLLRGHDAQNDGTRATTSAGTSPTGAPITADSQSRLTDSASVQRDVASLLARRLPSSGPAFPRSAAAPAADVQLAPSLQLDDPALPACAAEIEDGGALLGIDRVSFQGEASLLIVTTGATDDQASAWVIGPRCAEPGAGGIRTIVTTSIATAAH